MQLNSASAVLFIPPRRRRRRRRLQTCNRDFLCLFLALAGGPRVLHPRALLPDVHVRRRVGHAWPKYPVALLPSVEVRSRSRCPTSFCWSGAPVSQASLSSFRFFHRPADGSEVMYDPVSVMNADILNYCQKESWCKLGFYLLSFFYYLYRYV